VCLSVCHCDRLIKSVVVILSSLTTSLVPGRGGGFSFFSSLEKKKPPGGCLGGGGRENKPTVLRKQANAGDVRRIARLTGMFCLSLSLWFI